MDEKNRSPLKTLITLLTCLFFTIMFTAAQTTIAEQINWVPRAWVGLSDYQYKQGPRKGALADGSDFPKVEFDALLLMTGLGLSATSNNYYLDVSYQVSSEEEDSFSGADFYEKFKGDRKDYSVTLGMKILESRANVYLGYKNGKTSGQGQKGTRLTFDEDGFFIGASYGWVIADTGLLTFNVAAAHLDGHLREVPGPIYPTNLNLNADSRANGLSYGIAWNGKISKPLGYSIALDANNYEFDSLKDPSATAQLPTDIKENFYTAKFTLFYLF